MVEALPTPQKEIVKKIGLVTAEDLQKAKSAIMQANEDTQRHNRFREWVDTDDLCCYVTIMIVRCL